MTFNVGDKVMVVNGPDRVGTIEELDSRYARPYGVRFDGKEHLSYFEEDHLMMYAKAPVVDKDTALTNLAHLILQSKEYEARQSNERVTWFERGTRLGYLNAVEAIFDHDAYLQFVDMITPRDEAVAMRAEDV